MLLSLGSKSSKYAPAMGPAGKNSEPDRCVESDSELSTAVQRGGRGLMTGRSRARLHGGELEL